MNIIVLDGQISIFDIPHKEVQSSTLIKPQEKENESPIVNKFNELIEKFKDKCTRIFMVEGKLHIEIDDKTISYTEDGKEENIFIKDMLVRPKDEILVSNEKKLITEEQFKTLKKIQSDKYIKRKSDNNILIQYDNFCLAIYPSGHFAKWKSPVMYTDEEVYTYDELLKYNDEENKTDTNDKLNIGDKVRFDYHGMKEGIITWIYNSGESVNVQWDNKQTSFYYKSIEKIN